MMVNKTELKFFIMTKAKKVLYLLTVFFVLTKFNVGQEPTPNPENSSKVEPIVELNLVHLGDLIDIDVVGSLEYDWRGTLTPEGFLKQFDKIEEQIFALCKTEEEIAREIEKSYGKILRKPKVIVRILDRSNRPVSMVYGAVRQPQKFQIKRPVFLNELIVLVGGFTEKASGEIQIFRPQNQSCSQIIAENRQGDKDTRERFITTRQDNGSQFINIRIIDLLKGNKGTNLQILSGDIVIVLESNPIYVIGGVENPKQISTRSEMTLSRAISTAGGLTKDADAKKITIFRRVGNETRIIETDLDKIKANQAEDIVLQAFDIVEVLQKGREKRQFPPVIKIEDLSTNDKAKMPLRIID
jgi:protein involved in polysaccharide export with SLBB domain